MIEKFPSVIGMILHASPAPVFCAQICSPTNTSERASPRMWSGLFPPSHFLPSSYVSFILCSLESCSVRSGPSGFSRAGWQIL